MMIQSGGGSGWDITRFFYLLSGARAGKTNRRAACWGLPGIFFYDCLSVGSLSSEAFSREQAGSHACFHSACSPGSRGPGVAALCTGRWRESPEASHWIIPCQERGIGFHLFSGSVRRISRCILKPSQWLCLIITYFHKYWMGFTQQNRRHRLLFLKKN